MTWGDPVEIKALILAGGSGTRFWPRSTENKPKQFLKITSDKTMIQETFDRISKLVKTENIFVVSNENHSSHIHKQLNLPKGNVILRDAHNCGVFSNGIPVAIAHLDDIIVVVDENGVLVTKRGTTQDVKNIKL